MNRHKGFTLIEALLAIFITAVIITILSIVFNTGLRSYRQGRDLLEITRGAQRVMGTITSEISGALVNQRITFEGESGSVYFMAPVENSGPSDLCEVGYILVGNILKRHFESSASTEYPTGDTDYGSGSEYTFCENVSLFELHYYDGANWVSNWNSETALPEMIEVKIEIQGNYPKNNPSQKRDFVTQIYLPNSTSNP